MSVPQMRSSLANDSGRNPSGFFVVFVGHLILFHLPTHLPPQDEQYWRGARRQEGDPHEQRVGDVEMTAVLVGFGQGEPGQPQDHQWTQTYGVHRHHGYHILLRASFLGQIDTVLVGLTTHHSALPLKIRWTTATAALTHAVALAPNCPVDTKSRSQPGSLKRRLQI